MAPICRNKRRLEDLQSFNQTLGSAQNVRKADWILGQVLELLTEAEGVSKGIKGGAKPNDTDLLLYDRKPT